MTLAAEELEQITVPSEVLEAYFGTTEPEDLGDHIRRIGDGMINTTLLVEDPREDGKGHVILQRLSPMFDERVVNDATVVANHLAREGWEVPVTVPTITGEYSVRDRQRSEALPKGWLWRASKFIECDEPPENLTAEMYEAVGGLLGKLHRSLKGLDYQPEYGIEHFHETDYHMDTLREVSARDDMPEWARTMAAQTLADYDNLQEIPAEASEPQLIHADPRTGNMLFRDGKPFTVIDFDTYMVDSVWVDMGDLLRSLCEDAAERRDGIVPPEELHRVVDGYRIAAGLDYDPNEFFGWALTAAKRITLELTARFLNDTVIPYFAPNPEQYATREEFDRERATLQRRVYTNIDLAEQG